MLTWSQKSASKTLGGPDIVVAALKLVFRVVERTEMEGGRLQSLLVVVNRLQVVRGKYEVSVQFQRKTTRLHDKGKRKEAAFL